MYVCVLGLGCVCVRIRVCGGVCGGVSVYARVRIGVCVCVLGCVCVC